jgi:hypothetical protein
MDALISIQLFGHEPSYLPGDILRCDYQLDAVEPADVLAVEASVMWYTDGKGDEDIGVFHFERRVADDEVDANLCRLRSFRCVLPKSPLSYQGQLLQICWCVRVRAFLNRGKEASLDHPFWLGQINSKVPG